MLDAKRVIAKVLGDNCVENYTDEQIIDALANYVADYLFIGLTPEQVVELQEENVRLTTPDTVRINKLEQIAKKADSHGGIDHLVGLDELAFQNRLVILPCPIGGKVWYRTYKCATNWTPEFCDDWKAPGTKRTCTGCPHQRIVAEPTILTYSMIPHIGTTVFPTEQEALDEPAGAAETECPS